MIEHLCVVIPTFNRKASLFQLLTSLYRQPAGKTRISVIVVVDGSTDGTTEMVREYFPQASQISGNGEWWWTRCVNEGCRHALSLSANAVLLLNDDIRIPENYLEKLLAASLEAPGAIIGSLNLTEENPPRIFFSGFSRYNWWKGRPSPYFPFLTTPPEGLTGLHPSVALPGRGMLIPVNVFNRIGFFDHRHLPQYKADYDFVLRAGKHGETTLISWDSVIYTPLDSSGKGSHFVRQRGVSFLFSIFRKNSRTNLLHNFVFYFRHYPRRRLVFLPLTGLIILLRQCFRFYKSRPND